MKECRFISSKVMRFVLAIFALFPRCESFVKVDRQFNFRSSIHYTMFSPNDSIGLERFTTTKPGLLVLNVPFSKDVFQTLSFDPNVRSVLICGSQDEKMLRDTIEQVASVISLSGENSEIFRRQPYFFLIWPNFLNKYKEAEWIMRNIATSYAHLFHLNSDVYIVFNATNIRRPVLWEFYAAGTEIIYRKLKVPYRRIDLDDVEGKIYRRRNFWNMTIRATAANDPTYHLSVKFKEDIGDDEDNEAAEFESGMAVEILRILGDVFNFSIQASTGSWVQDNTLASDGRSTQSVKGSIDQQVMSGEADISISEIYVTRRRFGHLQFLHPTYYQPWRVYFRKPVASDFQDIFLVPFQWNAWITLLFGFLFVYIFLKVFLWLTTPVQSELLPENPEVQLNTESLMLVIGAVTQQGWHIQPESRTIRVIFFVGQLMGLVCFIAYSGGIVSTLSIKSQFLKSCQTLVDNNYQLVAESAMYPMEWSKHVPDLRSLHVTDMSVSEAVETLLTTKAALVIHADELYPHLRDQYYLKDEVKFTDNVICDKISFITLDGKGSLTKYAMFLRKGSHLADFFNSRFIQIMEYGLHHRLLHSVARAGSVTCMAGYAYSQHTLGFEDLYAAFRILAVGYVSSLLVLGLEILALKCRTQFRRPTFS